MLPHPVQQKPESNEQRQNGLKMVDQAIWSKKMSNGVRRTPVSAEQVCFMKERNRKRENFCLWESEKWVRNKTRGDDDSVVIANKNN